jgi:IS5 family transposase
MRPSFRPRASEGSRDDNAKIKAGETPAEWEAQPAKNRQKDKDARWTKKHGQSHYGYKNHINVDRRHKLVRRYAVTSASVHSLPRRRPGTAGSWAMCSISALRRAA